MIFVRGGNRSLRNAKINLNLPLWGLHAHASLSARHSAFLTSHLSVCPSTLNYIVCHIVCLLAALLCLSAYALFASFMLFFLLHTSQSTYRGRVEIRGVYLLFQV